MDPHQLQNNMNLGGHGQQPPLMNAQGQPQYNQMLLQQQYMNMNMNMNLPQLYNNNQQLMDAYQQQHYLSMMQTQQMPQMFQQQQPQILQQHLLSQQQQVQNQVVHQQRFSVVQQQQQQHQLHQNQQQQQQQLALQAQQQRLLEDQQRQLEQQRREQLQQEALRRQEEANRQRAKEAAERAEELRRQQELMKQQEKERLEYQRQQEELARAAEEQRRREEAERIETEKLMRIREQQVKQQKDSEQEHRDMTGRMERVAKPLSLVATHFMNKFTSLLPFPCENVSMTKLPSVCTSNMEQLVNMTDPDMVAIISKALSAVDVNDIITHGSHDGLTESNDLFMDQLPSLIKHVVELNSDALDVEPNHYMNMGIADTDIPAEIGDPLNTKASVLVAPKQGSSHEIPSTSAQAQDNDIPKVQIQLDPDAMKLRRQMASVGKQPKAGNQRRKRDQVGSLYDSLTEYFDPTAGRRRRTRTADDDAADPADLELIARMEAAEHRPAEEGTSGTSDDENKFYDKKKRRKKDDREERAPTPTEVIQQREIEWSERQRKRHEKHRRQRGDDQQRDCWNNEVMAENDSFIRFSALIDTVLEQVEGIDVLSGDRGDDGDEDEEINQELLIDRNTLQALQEETQKLKGWKKMNKVPIERLVKLISMLERNMRDVISQDGSRLLVPIVLDEDREEEDNALRELVEDRLTRAADAASTALMIMTSSRMPKQIFMEDAIERAINLCKQYLNYIIFPASDSMFRSNTGKKSKVDDSKRRRKPGTSNRSETVQHIYSRIAELLSCFSDLVKQQLLAETGVHQLATMSIATFFVSNVGELQLVAMNLAAHIFSLHDDHIRVSMLNDILNSLHRLPPGKNINNSYRLNADQWISNTTVLLLHLIQSAVKIPSRRKHDDDEGKNELSPDTIVKDSFRDSQKLANQFLAGFLAKCSCKGNKTDGEEDYRRLFDGFLQDLLVALYKPEWPAAEMMVTILGTLLVKHYRSKSTDIVIRQACLEYLGTITARLRKDNRAAQEDSEKRMEVVVKTLIFEEQEDQIWDCVDKVDISDMTSTDRLKKLEQALIDYLIDKKGDNGIEYAIRFYAGEWYKETAEDLDIARTKFKVDKAEDMPDKERRKLERKFERMTEKGAAMKEFLIKLVDKKHVRKRLESVRRLGNVLLDADATWAVKFLASRREFSHSFEIYLKHILMGVTGEGTVSLRTKAMKCLTQIIEADHEVLGMMEVRNAVNSRMMDPNAAVREATIELLGKFLLVKEEFIPTYYNILLERIKDSGTAVRKRVIRIMREICEKYPHFENTADMLSKLVRRVVDEDGVKKLVQDTFAALWFHPCSTNERGVEQLAHKVTQMTSVAQICAEEKTTDFLEQLLQFLLKNCDKALIFASKQIVDALVDMLLNADDKMATETSNAVAASNGSGDVHDLTAAKVQQANQEKLQACLTTLSIFTKVRPELMVRHAETLQPYLSMSTSTPAEQQVLNEVICMLERVVPLMSHPSDNFLQSVDERLAALLSTSGQLILSSAISCASAIWHKFPRKQTAMANKFTLFLRNLNIVKDGNRNDTQAPISQARLPMILRSIFTVGLLARHFDFDSILANDEEAKRSLVVYTLPPNQIGAAPDMPEVAEAEETNPEARRFRDNVFILIDYFSRNRNPTVREKALVALGHICAQYAEYLARHEVRNFYHYVLNGTDIEHLKLKIQTLRNLELFLLAEEKKMVKSNEDWDKAKELQNLKEMELAGSGLGSAVIQIYWNNVLNCYFSPDETVRSVAVQVTWMTLSQGLVTPGSSIPTLIAMTTDPLPVIRNKVENLLKDIDNKYSGMVQSKAINGIRIAFTLHSRIRNSTQAGMLGSVVRGIRACDASAMANNVRLAKDAYGLPRNSNDGQALLSGLYSSFRSNRSQRRSFLSSVLRLFSEDCREKLSLQEWIFVADNVAMFPYQVLDEPLYVIRQIDGILSLSGQSIVSQFRENLQIQQQTRGAGDDDAMFEIDTLYRSFPADTQPLYELMLNSQACFILLYLKNYLMKLYGFTDVKVQEYSPSEAAKVYEKAVTRKNVHIFNPSTALEELRPEVIEKRNSAEGHYNLAMKISSFRKMLLSLDRLEDDDDPIDDANAGVTENLDDDEDIDGEAEHEEAAEIGSESTDNA